MNKKILSSPAANEYIALNIANNYVRNNINSDYEPSVTLTGISLSQSGSDCICSNVLTGAIFYFQKDSDKIINAKADIFFTKSVSGSCNSNTDIEQFFQVKFVDKNVRIKYFFSINKK